MITWELTPDYKRLRTSLICGPIRTIALIAPGEFDDFLSPANIESKWLVIKEPALLIDNHKNTHFYKEIISLMDKCPKDFLSAAEAAEYLHLNKNHLYILARNGVIPCIRPLQRKVLFSLEDLRNYLMSHRCQSDQEILDTLK